MRLRRKTNIQEKIRQMTDFLFTEPIASSGGWAKIFGNQNPLHVELGAGKGGFITALAAANPALNFVAVERVADIIYETGLKRKQRELGNLYLVLDDIERLPSYFTAGEIERIYLNFSDPWPKVRHQKRRLTGKSFLEIYRELLQPDGEIHLKTDNIAFFDYSLLCLIEAGFSLRRITYDLHRANMKGNVMTEYEARFAQLGQPICRCEAIRPM